MSSIRSSRPPSPKSGARTAGPGVDADEVPVAGSEEYPLVGPVRTVRPVRHAALVPAGAHRGGAFLVALGVENPQRLARPRVDGGGRRRRHVDEEPVADHQGGGLEVGEGGGLAVAPPLGIAAVQLVEDQPRVGAPLRAVRHGQAQHGVCRLPAPRDLEVAEVLAVDLIQGRVLGAAEVAPVGPPFAVYGRTVLRRRGAGHGQRDHQADCQPTDAASRVGRSLHGSSGQACFAARAAPVTPDCRVG